VLAALAAAVALVVPASAGAATSSTLSMRAKITSFHATASGVVADGTLTGKLQSGSSISRDRAPVHFKAVSHHHRGRCNVITLRLAPLDLELLGVQVQTSHIKLDVYGHRGRVLGSLFCSLAHAKVSFPRAARAMTARLAGRPLHVFAASERLNATISKVQSCQVLKLVLGPLHLDLLGLVVDLYGKTHSDPVIVTIDAQPSKGLLGQLLCGLAGGAGVNSLAGLQSLLSSLGVNLSTTQIQNLLNQLGIGDISGGLTQLDLNRVLAALGLGSASPPAG
jgi:hypothetical protein